MTLAFYLGQFRYFSAFAIVWSLQAFPALLHNTGAHTCMWSKCYLRCCLAQREWPTPRPLCASSSPAAFVSVEQPSPQEWAQAGALHWSLAQGVRVRKEHHKWSCLTNTVFQTAVLDTAFPMGTVATPHKSNTCPSTVKESLRRTLLELSLTQRFIFALLQNLTLAKKKKGTKCFWICKSCCLSTVGTYTLNIQSQLDQETAVLCNLQRIIHHSLFLLKAQLYYLCFLSITFLQVSPSLLQILFRQ